MVRAIAYLQHNYMTVMYSTDRQGRRNWDYKYLKRVFVFLRNRYSFAANINITTVEILDHTSMVIVQ